jgi:hypothetical protein
VGSPVKTVDGKCYYPAAFRVIFKNLSIKNGHIDKVTFTNWSELMVPEFNLIEVDRDDLHWREEKEIQVRYSIVLDTNACEMIREKKDSLDIEARFYDNTGKLLNKADDGEPIYFHAGKYVEDNPSLFKGH